MLKKYAQQPMRGRSCGDLQLELFRSWSRPLKSPLRRQGQTLNPRLSEKILSGGLMIPETEPWLYTINGGVFMYNTLFW